MKIKHLVAAAALSIPVLMQAIPADPRVRTLHNPDGTTVEVRVHGDEFFNFMTDADRTQIIEKDARGFYVAATRNGMPLAFNRDNVEMMRVEAQRANPMFAASTRSGAPMQRMATLDGEGRSNYPTIGEGNRSLVVLVEFADVEFTVENPKEYYTRQLNEPGFSEYGGKGSALDYYKDASNGLYVPQFDVYGPVKISKNADYFKDNNSGHMALLIQESLTALYDSGEIDFSNYDLDENGTVDTVFFYYAGYGQADSNTNTIWPHQYDYQYYVGWMSAKQLIFDGKKVGPYACANELKGYNPQTNTRPWYDGSEPWVDGIGTFVHEYGHVLGLPDMYDVDYNPGTVTPGEWDVMDHGSYNGDGTCPPLYSGYEQWVCRWLEYTNAEDATHYELEALGKSDTHSAVRIRIPMSATGMNFQPEYFLIEARDNSGWDSCFPNPGLMVWRINYNRNTWVSNSVNSKNGSNVEIVYAKNDKQPLFSSGSIYKGADVELVPSKEYPLWVSPVITSINYDVESAKGSFDYNMAQQSDVFTLLHDTPVAAADGSRKFTMSWDAVDDVDGYLVTVKTKKSGKIIDDFDSKNVGNVTSVDVIVSSSMYWKLDMEAYVTCLKDGMASSKTSNVITFKPSDLPTAAVESIEDVDVSIFGAAGCIIAPEGAVAYNMAGQKVGMDNLAPGVYVVRYNATVTKVLVK